MNAKARADEREKPDLWMPWLIDKFLGDTTLLNTEQIGAYALLLMTAWKAGGRLPHDEEKLRTAARMTGARWRSNRETLLSFWRESEDGQWLTQKRLSIEYRAASARSAQASEAGAKGAAARWRKDGGPNGSAIGGEDAGASGGGDATAGAPPSAEAPDRDGDRIAPPSESHGESGQNPMRSQWRDDSSLSLPIPGTSSPKTERAAEPRPSRAPEDGSAMPPPPPAPLPAAAAEPADAEEPGGPCDPPGDPPAPPDPAVGFIPTPAGRVCRAMREAGLASVNPSDPRLLALLDAGGDIAAQEAEFRGIAAEAVSKASGWAWLLAVVERRRGEAGAIRARGGNGAASQPAEAPPPWLGSDRAVRAMAEQLGVVLRQGEDFDGWLRRIRAGWERAGRPALGGGAAPEAAAA